MAATRLLLGILCFAFTGSIGQSDRYLLNPHSRIISKSELQKAEDRAALVRIAENEIGVREKTGNNDGLKVESYLAVVKLKKGQPWCAAFLSWVYNKAGYTKPSTGWSPDMFPNARLARSALPGNILGIYFTNLKRIAHVGLIVQQKGEWITAVEGNTNVNGSREGDGVYRKLRHIKTIYRIADWVSTERRKP
jgi:hypothetical protein